MISLLLTFAHVLVATKQDDTSNSLVSLSDVVSQPGRICPKADNSGSVYMFVFGAAVTRLRLYKKPGVLAAVTARHALVQVSRLCILSPRCFSCLHLRYLPRPSPPGILLFGRLLEPQHQFNR
jgi:hypothetical protein